MRNYTDFLNESKERKFNTGDSVKRKKDGAIGEIQSLYYDTKIKNYFFTQKIHFYIINFGDGDKEYQESELEEPKQYEIDANKYNL